MGLVLSFIIFGLSICSFILGFIYLIDNLKKKRNWFYFFTTLGSALWGIGFGFLLIQTDSTSALFCRRIGMIGVFLYVIFGIKCIAHIAQTSNKLRKIVSYISYVGIILYPFLVMPERQTFYMSSFGMSYTFANDIWNTLYNLYLVVGLLSLTIVLVKMRKDYKIRRLRNINNGLWLFLIAFLSGTILDTVLPMLGIAAFPGSTLSQFIAIFIVNSSLVYERKNSLSLQTVSNHIYHSIDMPIIVLNNDKQIEFISDAAYKFFGIKKGSEHEINIKKLFVLDSEYEIFNIIEKNITKECFAKNNNAFCSITIEKVTDAYGDIVGYILLVTDLTDKQNFITELKKAKEIAENASKSKDNFLANMSHELRTPLNAVIGINELITNENDINKIKDYSLQVDRSSKSLLSIIDEIFDFSRIQAGKLDIKENEYNIVSLVKSIIETNKEFIESKNLTYEVTVEKTMPNLLLGDEERIKQCITNLLKNSIKYTETGKISLNIFIERRMTNNLELNIEVKDTGIGIKQEEIDNIFVSFKGLESSNNRNFEGIGLGLTIVKRLMTLMKGSFNIESKYKEGTRCILTLPQKIVDSTNSGGYSENNIRKALIINDKSLDMKILNNLLVKNAIEIDNLELQSIDYNKIKERNYDYIFVNYEQNNLEILNKSLKDLNVIYLIEEEMKLTDKIVIEKPLSTIKLNKFLQNKNNILSIEETNQIYAPKARILAVDDNKINLVVLKGFLKKTGANIDMCYSGTEALEMTEKNEYDIIFLDHMMPSMDGVETLKKIRSQNTNNATKVPIIVVTANAVEGAKEYYLNQGFTDYISKPVDSDILNKYLKEYLPQNLIETKIE